MRDHELVFKYVNDSTRLNGLIFLNRDLEKYPWCPGHDRRYLAYSKTLS